MLDIITGSYMVDGKPTGGTVQRVCAFCFMRGEIERA